ncbi:MAG: transcription termination factor Rho [Gemmatimonadales bacterium]
MNGLPTGPTILPRQVPMPVTGVLELLPDGAGVLRRREAGYLPDPNDVKVPTRLVRSAGLRAGDEIVGEIGRGERGRPGPLGDVTTIFDRPATTLRDRPAFERLTAVHPRQRLRLACDRRVGGQPDLTGRAIDLIAPFGRGQRATIVAPAKAGKTTVLTAVAEGIKANHPECRLLVLLVDERPEEVTEMESAGVGEVVASSFDRPAEEHAGLAELTIERARRLVELGEHVVIVLDSITRLARAFNAVETKSGGRTMSGGLGAGALERPKRLLGSARATTDAGSLTIVATSLIDTGSKMDQVIFEEFKGTGNCEVTLSRELAERRLFPAIDVTASGTRREELLLSPRELDVARALRKRLADLQPVPASQLFLELLRRNGDDAALATALGVGGG